MPQKAEPFGFRKGSVTVTTPPIELNPEIILPDINIPEIKIPEIKIPEIHMPSVTVQAPEVTVQAPVIKFEPMLRIEPVVKVEVQVPQGQGWKFTIHKLKNGDIEMFAKPI